MGYGPSLWVCSYALEKSGVDVDNTLLLSGAAAFLIILILVIIRVRRGPEMDGTVVIRSGPVEVAEFVAAGRSMQVPPNPFGVTGKVAGVRRRKGQPSAIKVHLRYEKHRGKCTVPDGRTEMVSDTEKRSYPLSVSYTSRRARMLSLITKPARP